MKNWSLKAHFLPNLYCHYPYFGLIKCPCLSVHSFAIDGICGVYSLIRAKVDGFFTIMALFSFQLVIQTIGQSRLHSCGPIIQQYIWFWQMSVIYYIILLKTFFQDIRSHTYTVVRCPLNLRGENLVHFIQCHCPLNIKAKLPAAGSS